MRRLRPKLVLPVALFVFVLALTGCGGEDGEGSNGTETSATTTQAEQRPDSAQAGAGDARPGAGGAGLKQDEPRPEGSDAPRRRIADVNPEGDAPPTAKQLGILRGGDNSLQTFGEDAEGDERDEVVAAMSAYFSALAAGGIEAACPYLAVSYRTGSGAAGGGTGEDCAELARLFSASPKGAVAAEARIGSSSRILRVGVEGDRAIVMLRTRRGELAYFTMQDEDGEWRATVPTVTVLP